MSKVKFKPDNTKQSLIFGYNVNEFLPENHIARLIDTIVNELDTSTIEMKYSENGQKSYDPKIIIKIIFYGYSIGVFSSRKLRRGCEQDVAFMYLARLYKPDHRTISDFRKNNLEELSEYFINIVRYCQELGMLNIGSIAIDGSKIKANASNDKMKTIEGYEKWEAKIKKQIEELQQQGIDKDTEEENRLRDIPEDEIPKELHKQEQLLKRIKTIKQKLQKRKEKKWSERPIAEPKGCLTDPDARFIKESMGLTKVNYNVQVETTEEQIIVGADVVTHPGDRKELIPMIEQIEENTNQKVKEVYADAGYSSKKNYKELSDREIDGYIPDHNYAKTKQLAKNPYDKQHFMYNKKTDTYLCPQGKQLYLYKTRNDKYRQNLRIYKCRECPQCLHKEECTTAKFRTITRHTHEQLQENMRKKLKSKAGQKKYNKRKWMIEPVFGHFKKNLGFRQFLLRGKEKVKAEFRIICICYNILKIYNWKLAQAC